jgi:hypothetical protein
MGTDDGCTNDPVGALSSQNFYEAIGVAFEHSPIDIVKIHSIDIYGDPLLCRSCFIKAHGSKFWRRIGAVGDHQFVGFLSSPKKSILYGMAG